MLVSQLIEKLQKCNPKARVCVEANADPCSRQVVQYSNDSGNKAYVYICDSTEYLDDVIDKNLLKNKKKM